MKEDKEKTRKNHKLLYIYNKKKFTIIFKNQIKL